VPNVAERDVKYISDLIRLLAPQPERAGFALRMALICALTVLLTEIYQTPEPALTTYIVFFLNHTDRTTSLIFNAVLLVLISLIIAFILLVAMAVVDDPMWRVSSIAAISFCLLFLASASKLRPIGSIIALIVGFALDELGAVRLGEEATRGYLYVWLFIGIPVGVSIVVNFLLAPSPRRLAERAIALRLELSAAMLRVPDQPTRGRFLQCLREGTVEINKWLELLERERTSRSADVAALRQAAGSTLVLLSAIDVMDRNPDAVLPPPLREYLAQTLDKMAGIMMSGGYPVEVAWQSPDDDPLLFPIADEVRAEIKEAIVRFTAVPDLDKPPEDKPKEPHGFFELDAFTNPEHVHYALKTTGAAIFCYLLYSLLDWPGIHTSFITVYIVSLGTTAETVEKLALRILGCLIGACAGIAAIVFVIPSLTSIGALMAIVFVGAYAAAYVAAGSQRISYAGFQIAFAFFLCVVQGSAPAFDMTIARDRVIGILIGNLVVYLVFTNLWPVSVGKRIDPAIASLLRCLGAMMTAASPRTRRALASQSRSTLAAIQTDIELAGYEPSTVRPTADWLAERRSAVREIDALQSPLLLSSDLEAPVRAYVANRLERLGGRFLALQINTTAPSEAAPTDWTALPLFCIIDSGLRRLEQTPD
jgi:multidrug resistance protein MdtO